MGVILGVEISTAISTNAPTITVSYTNDANTASRTGTNTVATTSTSPAGTFYPIGLQAGDTGVRSVQTLTLSASWVTGAVHLVAYRVLATLELSAAGIPNAVDALTSGMPRCYDTTVPFLIFIPPTTTTTQLSGSAVFTQG